MVYEKGTTTLLNEIGQKVDQLAKHCVSCPQFKALHEELVSRVEQLSQLIEVNKAMVAQLDLDLLLQQIVDIAPQLVRAEIGGLLVRGHGKGTKDGPFEHFIVNDRLDEVNLLPVDLEILSLSYQQGTPVRLDDLRSQDQPIALFANRLGITTFLSVPLILEGRASGTLFVANPPNSSPFGADDEELLLAFGAQAAIAIENARLYTRAEDLARQKERQRIAQALHDTVVQNLFTIGLESEWCIKHLGSNDSVKQRMQVIHRLGTRSSCELRSAIFALRSPYLAKGTVLVDLLHDQVRDFQAMSGIAATLIIPPQFPNLPLPIGEAIYRIVCESLSNVHKHAKAQAVVVSLHDDERAVILTVQDDGIGLSDPAHLENCSTSLHFGIEIMRQLTEQVQGEFFIANNDDQGVMVRAHIPVHGASPS